ncbi:hypothetical protein [Catenuloplanes nepalensis]|uniref:hypothetical protein n=1 Tax=Catenuloplanes nepalensis TaxID=587533 RepID=UPI0027D838FA|nr:hypothetical protein [Catenuloplanes nepalensis]
MPPEQADRSEAPRVAWLDILARWRLLEADLHDVYGVDLGDPVVLRTRSWRWLETRILGLLSADTRLHRALFPPPETPRP